MLLEPQLIAELLILGLAAGFLAGLLGIGGGMVMVPAVAWVLGAKGFPPEHIVKMAVATSLATICFTSISSVRAHHPRDGRHHQHAAADAQQSGEETGDESEQQEFGDQLRFKEHRQDCVASRPATGGQEKRCLQVPPDRHPEPGFRWARSTWCWVHLTRDDHAHQGMFQARALRALVQGNIKPGTHCRHGLL